MKKQTTCNWKHAITSALLGLLLAGCQSAPYRDPAYAPARPAAIPMPQPQHGSLYRVGWDVRLFEDARARRVGDMLTINLVESTTGTKSADTDLSKTTSINVTNPTILGATPQFNVPSRIPLTNTTTNTLATDLDSTHTFAGESESTQSNSLTGSVTVSVVEVLPNGYLMVRGEKLITINRGDEYIQLSGIVRPEDIGPDNTVASTRIGDVQIAYSGRGETADSNAIGWLARFFISAILPF